MADDRGQQQPRFWWFQGASVEQLFAELEAAGENARLEVHLDGQHMTLHVVAAGITPQEGGGGGINESHVCPPVCP